MEGNPLAGFGESLLKGDDSGNAVEIIAALRSFAQTGSQPNYRAKLIIVGNGRIGKTCLIKRLKGLDCEAEEKYTHGIAISQLDKQHLPEVHTDELYLNVWDFGGQEVFYATHQFFLSEEAAYIYAWTDEVIAQANWEKDEYKSPVSDKWRDHEYWLDNIRMHGKNSPVLVVKTHCMDATGVFPAERLLGAYNIKREAVDFEAFSPDARYLNNMKTAVTALLNQLPLLGTDQPKGFYNLVNHIAGLREAGEKELSKTAFEASLEQFRIPAKDAGAALSYLHKTGEVIHFPDAPRLSGKVFTDPGVLTERIYKLIENNDELIQNEGSFVAEDAHQKLGEDWEDLLELLIAFQLVYRKITEGQTTYIAPQYLPPLPTKGNAHTLFAAHERGKLLQFTLHYPRFMPENVMVNVLSAYGPYSMDAAYRDAIYFCKEGQEEGCIIRTDEAERKVYVHSASTPAGNALAREVFLLFVELSKKAELHIAASEEQWVHAKALEGAMNKQEAAILPTIDNNGWVGMADFTFLLEEKGHFRGEKTPTPENTPPMGNNSKERIRQLITKSKVEEALKELTSIKPDEATRLQERFARLKAEVRDGILTQDAADAATNKIVKAVLEYAAEVENTDKGAPGVSFVSSTSDTLKPKRMTTLYKWIIGLTSVCVLALILGVSGVVRIPGIFEFETTPKLEQESPPPPSETLTTVIGSVQIFGGNPDLYKRLEVKVKGVNTVNPVSLSGRQFTLRGVSLPADRRLEIALVFPDYSEEARVFNIGQPDELGRVDIGDLRVQIETKSQGQPPRIIIKNQNIIQNANNNNSADSGNQQMND